jgi:hypothetical protein
MVVGVQGSPSVSEENTVSTKHRLLDPALHDLSPRHIEVYWRYQVVRTAVDFGAAACFVVGSIFFFFERTTTLATWLFLVGSLLFAVKPTIDLVRSLHLNRLPETLSSSGRRPLPDRLVA